MSIEIKTTYRPMANPAELGELRMMTWQMAVYAGTEAEREVWEKRCRAYWARQGELYGLVMGDFLMLIEPPDQTGKPPFISTYAPVLAILPGERHASMVGNN